METFTTVLSWIGYIFAIVGFCGTVWKTVQVWTSLKTFSWGDFDKYSKTLVKNIQADGFYPEIIVTIGRGGAIVGSVISGNLHRKNAEGGEDSKNIPILGCDRIYEWQSGQRIEVANKMVDLAPLNGKSVLLVAGDVLTGGTMKCFLTQLREVKPAVVKTACLVKGVTATFSPDYVGKEIPGDFRMPWMYKGYGYIRDSRRPQKT